MQVDDKCVMLSMKFMTTPESESAPNKEERRDNGPNVLLRNGQVEGSPGYESFRDMSDPENHLDGSEKKGNPSAAVLEEMKTEWMTWVNNPAHGASLAQQNIFGEMMEDMVSTVDAIPDRVRAELPEWRLPLPVELRGTLPVNDAEQQIAPPKSARPDPRVSYGDMTSYQAKQEQRQWDREARARAEMLDTREKLPRIKKGDLLFVKVLHDGSTTIEWYLGVAMKTVPAVKRNGKKRQMVDVWWREPRHNDTTARPAPNDLNVKFKPYFLTKEEAQQRGLPDQKNIEAVDRVSVGLIGLKLVKGGVRKYAIKEEHMKAIADLNVGFKYDRKNNVMTYDNGLMVM